MISSRGLIISGASLAAVGSIGLATWPRLGGYEQEVDRQRRLLESDPR